jgi:ribosome-associated protein
MKRKPKRSGDPPPSKTSRKRESRSLQELGEALIDLPPGEVDELDLPGRLREALEEARRIKSHEALRRQRQFIGRLMREIDAGPVRDFLDRRQAVRDSDTRVFHAAESWRRRLLQGEPDSIEQCAATLGLDQARLRNQVEAVFSAHSDTVRKGASRALFRALHEAIARGQRRTAI